VSRTGEVSLAAYEPKAGRGRGEERRGEERRGERERERERAPVV
jgi:hypothetical protein